MKKFFKTTLVVEVITKDKPLDGTWVQEFEDSILDNSDAFDPTTPSVRVQTTSVLSPMMAAKKIEEWGGNVEDYEIDEDGNDLEEEEHEDEGISYEELNEEEEEDNDEPCY